MFLLCVDGLNFKKQVTNNFFGISFYYVFLGAEVLTGNTRVVFTTMGVCLCFAFGYMVLPLFAYFLRNWRFLMLAISLPGLVFLPLWW